MSSQALTFALNVPAGVIAATDRHVMLVIANYADASGRTWVGRERLARETGLARETVSRSIKRICGAGLMNVKRAAHKVKSGQWVNVYQFLMDGTSVALTCDPVEHAEAVFEEGQDTTGDDAISCDAGSPLEDASGDARSPLAASQGVILSPPRGDAGSPEPNRELKPPLTPPAGGELPIDESIQNIMPWEKFETRWQDIVGWRINENRARSKAEFLKLQPADRLKACERIKAWKGRCNREKPGGRLPRAVAYLRNGFWKPLERAAPAGRPFVSVDNPHWPALCERMRRDVNPRWSGSLSRECHPPGWNFPSDWAETNAAVAWAEAQIVDRHAKLTPVMG
ncbi:MAG: helix-turn-helix domain-containing protein [Hyphomicrobiales bacterium]|nr:helix-turn-helix domain-containing protein [Hyphomicrobiales bacterium]